MSKLIKTKNNSKYLIGYSDDVIRPLILILSKTSEYVEVSKDKGGYKNKNNKLMSLRIDDAKPIEKYGTIQTNTEDL